MDSHSENTKRIAKNTGLLYIRTIVMMLISLYTSRIVLEALGVDNYGINNVVGGVVGMFSVISGSLSGSISRFLTFALGEGNYEKLRKVFSLCVSIQVIIGLSIIVIGEIVGVWFINNKLNISPDRLIAAHWVFQCGLFSFFTGLISVPYNACLIAHERMGIFAYMTIIEATVKLLIAYAIFITPFDKLITLSVLNMGVAIFMRLFYGWYCARKFEECRYEFKSFDKGLAKEMTSFAGWAFFGNTAWMFNTQGVNILVNVFFGVAYNAARGVAGQVEGAVMGFVNNFSTAVNPQITKSYAKKDWTYLFPLICNGTKYQFFLMLLFLVPIEFEADTLLSIWLIDVPPLAPLFLRLSLLCTVTTLYGGTTLAAIIATGKIRRYQLSVTAIGCLVFPLTWIGYKMGLPVYSTYLFFMFIYLILIGVRLFYLKVLMGFPISMFIRTTVFPSIYVAILACIIPAVIVFFVPSSLLRFFSLISISVISTLFIVLFIGMTRSERDKILNFVKEKATLTFCRRNV